MDVSTRPLTDAELIVWSWRDAEQFGALFDRHFAAMHNYLARRAGSEAADDLASETFVVAFRRRHTYRPDRDDARPWLYGFAAILLRSRSRIERRQLLVWERAAARDLFDADMDGVVARADAQSASAVVGLALAGLAACDREALTLFAWAGLSYDEIAEALDVPLGTVRSRIHRARKQVREVLVAHGLEVETVVRAREG